MKTSQSLSLVVIAFTAILLLSSPDPFLTLFAGAVLALGVNLLWPETGTPVLLLPFLLQWMSVSVKPIQSALTGQPLNDFLERGSADLSAAAWFSLFALAALAIGMKLGAGGSRRNFAHELSIDAVRLPKELIIKASLVSILAGHALDFGVRYAGPLTQPVLMMANIKLAGLFVLTYWCLSRGRSLGLLAVVVGFETINGMTGYFGEFRPVVLTTALAALAARPKVNFGTILAGSAGFVAILTVVIFWSAIKPDYRSFVSGGADAMIVTNSLEERLTYLADAATSFEADDFDRGLDSFVSRLSYIDFLAHAMGYTPRVMPFTGGTQTIQALTFLIPRAVWPGKPVVPHDTVLTARYTGLGFTSMWASISLGYLAELYIDFGTFGALIAMLALGFAIGRAYRVLIDHHGLPTLANVALAAAAVMPVAYFERALLKIVGGGLTMFLAALVIQRFIMPRALAILDHRKALAAATAAGRNSRHHTGINAAPRRPLTPRQSPPPHVRG